MDIAVLGPLALDGHSVSWGRRDRVVLAALAARTGQAVSADQLADALWHDGPPVSAGKVVQGCVSRLRRELGREVIETVPGGYRLAAPIDAVDAARFERMVARARELLSLGESDRAGYLLGEALALWRGPALAELENWHPGMVEAGRFDELRLEAEELRVDAFVQAGRFDEVLAQAETMVRAAPLRERRWGLLASAQYQAGRQGEALRTIAQARAMLVDGLGIDPGPELGALEQAILRQDDSLLISGAPRSNRDGRCPYRGLSAYDVTDAEEFFGRDADLQACWDILEARNVLAVVGPSGFGKSSLVRAGIAARMIAAGRRVQVMSPGPRPAEELDAALDGPAPHLLVVDQAEELFSLSENEHSLSELVERLVHVAHDTQVVLALRADRLADVSAHPGLARLVEQGLHLLGPLDETALREVIESPARQHGLILEPGLVDLLVREVEDEPGALPLLSYALAQTWRRREANTLTVAGYQATGGIRGAVTKTAEALYKQVDPTERHLLRDVLLRLVAPGPAAEPVRTRLPRRLIAAEPTQDHLVDLLIAARLVTSEEGLVEIAHESLTRAWPRLRGWLDDDVEGQRIRHHLIGAADAWDSLGRPASELYRGTRLAQAQEWRHAAHRELSVNERDFLDTAAQAAHDEQAALAAHAQAQTRMVRRLRGLLAAGAILLAVSLVAGSLAVRQTGIADEAAQSARAAGLTAEAGRLGARALTLNDPSTSLLLAAEAVQLQDNVETRSYLRAALQRQRGLVASTTPVPQAWGFALDPTGTRFAVAGLDNDVTLIDADSGKALASAPIRGQETYNFWTETPIGFSALTGAIAVATPGYIRSPVQLLHADSLEPLPQQLRGQPTHARAFGLDLSADGRYLAVTYLITDEGADDDERVLASDLRVWDLATPEARPRRIPLERKRYYDSVQISDDGRVAYVSGPLRAFSVGSGALLWEAAEAGYSSIALSPDGRFLVFPPQNSKGLVVFGTRTGREVGRLAEDDAGVRGWPAIWSDDSSRLAARVGDEVRVWRWPSMKQELAYTMDLFDLAFSHDGSQLHVGVGGAIQTWDLAGAHPLVSDQETVWTTESQMRWIEPSPDGRFLAGITDGEWNALMLDTRTMEPVTLGGSPPKDVVTTPTWSPDSSTAVVGLDGGDVAVMHADLSWERRHVSAGELLRLEYSPDGQRVLVAERSGRMWLSDADTLRRDTPIRTVEGIWEPRLLPDGHAVFATTVSPQSPHGEPDGWQVVDLDSGDVISRGTLPEAEPLAWTNSAVAPTGPARVAMAHDRGALLLDLSTGRMARAPVAAHGTQTYTVSFSSDGSRFVTATGEGDGSIALWDGHTGELLDTMDTESGEASYAFVQEDGTVLIATSGSLSTWDPTIDTAIQAACRMAGRSLTRREWSQHVGDRAYHETCPAT